MLTTIECAERKVPTLFGHARSELTQGVILAYILRRADPALLEATKYEGGVGKTHGEESRRILRRALR